MLNEGKRTERLHLPRTRHSHNHLVSMSEIPKRRENEPWIWMILMTTWCINLEQEIFLGVFWFLDSKWWWSEMNTKDYSVSVRMLKLVQRTQSYRLVCKLMSTKKNVKKKKISNPLCKPKKAMDLHSVSNPRELDLFLISAVFKRLSSLRWNNLKNQRTPPNLCPLNSIKQDLAHTSVYLWTNKIKW